MTIIQLLDVAVCHVAYSMNTWNTAFLVAQLFLGTVMCILVVTHFVRDSFQMRRATGIWQLNRYMALLVREGLLYFLAYARPLPFSADILNSITHHD